MQKKQKKVKRAKTLGQLNKLDELVRNINKYFAPDPENKNSTRKYSVFSMALEPAQLDISVAYEFVDAKTGPTYFMGLVGEPFLSGAFKFDIIQFICAYCKIDMLVSRCRAYLDKHGTSVECYIQFKPEVNIKVGAAFSIEDKEWSFNIPEGNQLQLAIEGVVSATFEAEVFVVDLKFGAEGAITATAGFELDQHADGLDIAGFHDGIKGSFEFAADIVRTTTDDDQSQTVEPKEKQEWQLADPLKAADSALRMNLYGKIRPITPPPVTPERWYESVEVPMPEW